MGEVFNDQGAPDRFPVLTGVFFDCVEDINHDLEAYRVTDDQMDGAILCFYECECVGEEFEAKLFHAIGIHLFRCRLRV